jgi:hypothetical protein
MALHPIPDLGVLKTADAFRAAAQILNACSDSSMSVPTVVNAAFALELYLKSLNMEWQLADPNEISNTGKKAWLASRSALQKGHIPSDLFEALEQSIRDDLEQQYELSPHNSSAQSLKEALQGFDGLFVDWRYIFEGKCKPVDLPSLFAMLAFFSETIHAAPQERALAAPVR